jgi:hypothetical protein
VRPLPFAGIDSLAPGFATLGAPPRHGVGDWAGARAHAVAKETKTPPKPQNVLSPDAVLQRLMKGNERNIESVSRRHDFKHEREVLAGRQNPFAAVLGCADSRIAP